MSVSASHVQNRPRSGGQQRLISLGRLLLGMVIALGLLACVGATWQALATRRDTVDYPAPGQLVIVEDRHWHLQCEGAGPVTVLFEGGTGEWSSFWGLVQPEIAPSARACAYDRAGLGWSDAVPDGRERTGAQLAAELHAVLQVAGESGPYVLVAHSAGALYARAFRAAHPDEVVGMVLVEGLYEELLVPLPDVFASSQPVFGLCQAVLTPLGLVRAGRLLPQFGEIEKLPASLQAAAIARLNRADFCGTAQAETAGLELTAAALQAQLEALDDLPLVVIQAGQRAPDDWPSTEAWTVAQQRLAALSTRSQWVTADSSGHYVQLDQPNVVVDAITQVLAHSQ
jgi:pimeloyl-ACP methyl ester carboxylesterase